jgi:TldD protein
MGGLERREFLKLAGTGVGVVMASSLFHDKLLAGTLPVAGAELFSSRFGVAREDMQKVLQAAMSKGGDFAELYFEYKLANFVVMEDDIIRQSSEDITLGVGIRVLKGKQTGFGFTSDLSVEKMTQAALTAAAIAASSATVKPSPLSEQKPGRQVYLLDQPFGEAGLSDRIAMVKEGYAAALGHDKRIVKVRSMLADELQYITIANSEGLLISDARPQVRLTITATGQDGKVRNTGAGSAGGRVGRSYFQGKTAPKEIGLEAAKEAIILLSAGDAAPGDQPVVCGSKQSGVMVHEAVGHPFEGDSIWQKTSIMWDKQGQMIANPIVTIYDDATVPHLRGSFNVDDEGTPTQKAMMIEKGKLVGYLHDRLSARALGVKPNGHGRRQSFSFVPIPRMNNTFLEKGEASTEDIIKSVKKGFYAHSYMGGQVEDTGKFTFSVGLGYLIEDGKLTKPVKNATLIGVNTQVLKDIEMIGSDTDFFLGTCGKEGQSAPCTAGTPTFKIRQMTVGGRT